MERENMKSGTSYGQGTIRQKRPNLYEGRFFDGSKQRSVYGKTKTEVRRKLTELKGDVDNLEFIRPDKITVAEWSKVWQRNYLADVKPATLSSYEYYCRVYIRPFLGKIKLQALTAPMCQAIFTKAQQPQEIATENGETVKTRGLSPSSLKGLKNALSRCLSQAVDCDYIAKNPCKAVVLPPIIKREMNVLDPEIFLQIIKGDEFENLLIVDLFTGLRQSEIIGLQWSAIDFRRGFIRIDKQYHRIHGKNAEGYTFSTTKNGKTRTIVPAKFVLEALKREKARQSENQLKYGSVFENEHGLVFTNEIGQPLPYSTLYSHLKAILKQHGITDVRFHDLRHSYATYSLENGDDIKTVSECLGHSSVSFTLDVYGHVTDAMKLQSAEKMQAMIERIAK